MCDLSKPFAIMVSLLRKGRKKKGGENNKVTPTSKYTLFGLIIQKLVNSRSIWGTLNQIYI
jgi:hypothetical protein